MPRSTWRLLATPLLLVPLHARADHAGYDDPRYAEPVPAPQKQFSLTAKGGVGAYVGGSSNETQTGPTWGATLAVQPFRIIGLELGYEGSHNATLGNGPFPESGALLRNGGDALIKLAPPFIEAVKPFLGAGVGVSYVTQPPVAGNVARSDLMEEVPLSAGVEFNSHSFTAGVRATYRLLLDDQLLTNQGAGAGLVDASVTLGGRF